MGKILISLEVPAIDEKYDVFVPGFLSVGMCIVLLSKAISDMTQKKYVPSGKEVLLYRSAEGYIVLDEEYTISDYGLKNGDLLYIF